MPGLRSFGGRKASAVSKRFSKPPEKFGSGHVEGIVDASAPNNASLSGAYVPALVFGIPGDSITAIVIGGLPIKGMTPGAPVTRWLSSQIEITRSVQILTSWVRMVAGAVGHGCARCRFHENNRPASEMPGKTNNRRHAACRDQPGMRCRARGRGLDSSLPRIKSSLPHHPNRAIFGRAGIAGM